MKKQMQRTSSQFNQKLRMHEVKIHLTIELITLCSPGSERLLMLRSRVKVVPLSLKIKPFNQFLSLMIAWKLLKQCWLFGQELYRKPRREVTGINNLFMVITLHSSG